jgi:hypothetical protein
VSLPRYVNKQSINKKIRTEARSLQLFTTIARAAKRDLQTERMTYNPTLPLRYPVGQLRSGFRLRRDGLLPRLLSFRTA